MSRKSRLYQHKIVEISFDQAKLNNFPTESGIGHVLATNEISEEIKELRETLMDELYNVIHGDFLTDHQKKVLMMRLMGKTQNEIAEHLGITQSAVHKAMHGNIDYKNNKKRYGGIVKKLRKICSNNENIKEVLDKIDNVRGDQSAELD